MIFFAVFDIFLNFGIHKKTKLFLFINISAFGQEMNKRRPMSRSCFFWFASHGYLSERLPFWTVTWGLIIVGYVRMKNSYLTFLLTKYLFRWLITCSRTRTWRRSLVLLSGGATAAGVSLMEKIPSWPNEGSQLITLTRT